MDRYHRELAMCRVSHAGDSETPCPPNDRDPQDLDLGMDGQTRLIATRRYMPQLMGPLAAIEMDRRLGRWYSGPSRASRGHHQASDH